MGIIMEEVLTQVVGLTKEVAVAYLIVYGVVEILQTVVVGIVGWHGMKALAKLFKMIFEV